MSLSPRQVRLYVPGFGSVALLVKAVRAVHFNMLPIYGTMEARDAQEEKALKRLRDFAENEIGYQIEQTQSPQTIGYALTDSPVGQAAWFYEKYEQWTDHGRTCWHEHAHVQTLVIENGVALVQAEGGPIEVVRAGQTIVCEPGVRHWHGAATTHTMTQFGITLADDGGNYATWGEQVTDDEYDRADSSKI